MKLPQAQSLTNKHSGYNVKRSEGYICQQTNNKMGLQQMSETKYCQKQIAATKNRQGQVVNQGPEGP